MKRIWFGLMSLLSLVPILISGQGRVQISGKFKPPIANTIISVYKPVDGIFNMALPDSKNETSTKDGSFRFEFTIDKPGFVRLQCKDIPKIFFYTEPGGKIEISFLKDESGGTKVVYRGSNADANNLLATNSPMSNQNFLQYRLPEIFQTESAEALTEILKQEIEKSTLPFAAMLKKNRITRQCHEIMMRETEQAMMHWVNTYLKNYMMPDNELPHVTKLNKDEVRKLAQLLYSKYDPYDNKYATATRTYNNQMIKSILIEDGAIGSRKETEPGWSMYAKEFNMIISRLSAIDQAPDVVQMNFMGASLLAALAFKPMSDGEFLKIFNVYYTKFPNSPFNRVITNCLNIDSLENKKSISKEATGVYHFQPMPDTLSVMDFKDVAQIKDIKELVKKYFNGQPVFVDFWATWCSPCIAEFQNEPALREFLDKKKVATLYVSIDSENAASKWKTAIARYQLSGYHYLALGEIRGNLDKWFFGIPRYMLFNSSGELVDDNLPKPSSKVEFIDRINQLLKN